MDKCDGASGKPWLCLSVQFDDRTIDIVGENEQQVQSWFIGLASLTSLSGSFAMSRGMLLWQRTIMKFNHYGIPKVRKMCKGEIATGTQKGAAAVGTTATATATGAEHKESSSSAAAASTPQQQQASVKK